MVVFNEIVKKDFNIDRDSIQIQEQKKLMNLFKKNHMNFRIQKKKLILIIWYISTKLKKRNPKDFSKYQNLIDLFKDLRYVNVNPRKVLKNQTDFKSHLDQVKEGNQKSKSKDQISVI